MWCCEDFGCQRSLHSLLHEIESFQLETGGPMGKFAGRRPPMESAGGIGRNTLGGTKDIGTRSTKAEDLCYFGDLGADRWRFRS